MPVKRVIIVQNVAEKGILDNFFGEGMYEEVQVTESIKELKVILATVLPELGKDRKRLFSFFTANNIVNYIELFGAKAVLDAFVKETARKIDNLSLYAELWEKQYKATLFSGDLQEEALWSFVVKNYVIYQVSNISDERVLFGLCHEVIKNDFPEARGANIARLEQVFLMHLRRLFSSIS